VVGDDWRRTGSVNGLRSVPGRAVEGDVGEPRDATDAERLIGAVVDE